MADAPVRLRVLVAALVAVLVDGCVPPLPAVTGLDGGAARQIAIAGWSRPLLAWPAQGPAVAVVLGIHGLRGSAAVFAAPARMWSGAGLATYAVTLDQATMSGDDIAAAVRAVAQRHPTLPLVVVGESLGASLVLAALAPGRSPPVAAVVLAAPAVWPDALSAQVAVAALRLLDTPAARFWAGVVEKMDAARDAAAPAPCPVLVLSGRRDTVVSRQGTTTLVARLGAGATWWDYPDGGHTLFRDPGGDANAARVGAWVAAQARAPAARTAASAAAAAAGP
ncbi:MAG: alpha/beta hydrolase, partial [Magnetospirillum sp.]|nr:alpha/beta hydrolase [Magnetospirillum sp.]